MTLQELSQLYYLNNEIEYDIKRLEALRNISDSTTGNKFSGMPFCGNKIKITEKTTVEINALQNIINDKIIKCTAERERLERYINSISDSITRQIFTLRFIKGFSWRQVALIIGGGNTEGSVRHVCYRYVKKRAV